MTINQAFGLVIRKLRNQKGWSQEKFAEIANIHRTYVSSIELGKVSISLQIAKGLAESLSLQLSELILRAERLQQKGR